MSFLTVGGDGSQRPTFFELIAADRLMPSLKAAIVFSLSVTIYSPARSTVSGVRSRFTRYF